MLRLQETTVVSTSASAARRGARLLAVGFALAGLAGAGALPARAAADHGPAPVAVARFQQTAGVGGTASGGATHGSVATDAAPGAATGGSVLPTGASEPAPADCSLLDTTDAATAAAIGAVLSGNPALTSAGNVGITNPSAIDAGASNSDPAGTLAALPDAATAGCGTGGDATGGSGASGGNGGNGNSAGKNGGKNGGASAGSGQ